MRNIAAYIFVSLEIAINDEPCFEDRLAILISQRQPNVSTARLPQIKAHSYKGLMQRLSPAACADDATLIAFWADAA